MTLRNFDTKYSFFKLTHDYRALPTLVGTINDSYRENMGLDNDTRYFVLRKLSMYRDLKKALVEKKYEIRVTIEKLWESDGNLHVRWHRFLALRGLRNDATKISYQFVNWYRWLYHKDPLILNQSSSVRRVVQITPELQTLLDLFYAEYQASRVSTRMVVKLPITYILDSLKYAFNLEASTFADRLHLYSGVYYSVVPDINTYGERREYTRNKAANRKLPRVVRPRLQASDSKKNFLKYLMTALFPTNLVRVRKKKAAAKRTIYFFDAPEGGTDYYYFDLDDTTSCKMTRNSQQSYLVPNFMLQEGVYKHCAATGLYFRDQARSILRNTPENQLEIQHAKDIAQYNLSYLSGNLSTDLNYRKDILTRFGITQFVDYVPPIVTPLAGTPTIPIPAIEDDLTYENHINAYLNASFTAVRSTPVDSYSATRVYLMNNYTMVSGAGVRLWKLKGMGIYSRNSMNDATLSHLNGVRGDTTERVRFLRDRAVASGEFLCISQEFLSSINSVYPYSSYFLESDRVSSGRTERFHSYGGNSEVGPGVIRNYTFNPMDAYPGLRVASKEKPALQNFIINRSALSHPQFKYKSGSVTFKKNAVDTTLYMGVELEVTPNRNAFDFARTKTGYTNHYLGISFAANVVERYLSKKKMGVIKADGSTVYGFEIVTVPGTLEWHNEAWEGFFKEDYSPITEHLAPSSWLSGWINNGVVLKRAPWEALTMENPHSTPTCGIHIHVSKAALSPLQLGKILTFVNDVNNQGFVHRVAGRSANAYSNFSNKKLTFGYQIDQNLARNMNDRGVNTNMGYEERYSAVNIQTGKPTIEFRIFRSNVAKAGFMKNLDFVHALCTWCRDVSLRDLNVNTFLAFVEANKGKYTWFYRWCVEKDYFKTRHTFNPLKSFETEERI